MTAEEREAREGFQNDAARGRRIESFLTDEVVRGVLEGLQLSYYNAWKQAPTPTDRERIYSQVSAFDALRDSLQAIVASGERATHELTAMDRDTD